MGSMKNLRPAWVSGLTAAFGLNAAHACSVEIHSIADIFGGSHRVIVGVVESVQVDSLDVGLDEPYPLTREASLRVERNLKGDANPDPVQLSFPSHNTCSDNYQGYGRGDRFILMMNEPDDNGVYRAPSIPPFRLRLPATGSYESNLLYRYVEGLAIRGEPPVSITVSGEAQQMVGHALGVDITIANALASTLTVQVSDGAPPRAQDGSRPALDGFSLWIHIGGVVARHAGPDLFRLATGDTQVLESGDFFYVATAGPQWVRGFLWLPGGETQEPFQRPTYEEPLQGPFQGIWGYEAVEGTAIDDLTWGGLKAR